MRRLRLPLFPVTLILALSLLATACGNETVTAGGDLLPTPAPAPTLAGEATEVEPPEFQAQVVMIGVSADQIIEVKALPGLEQPSAGQVEPGTPVNLVGQTFETEDGLIWWQVQAGTIQGWIQPQVAYQGPSEIITDQVVSALGPDALYPSPEDAATQVAAVVGRTTGTSEVQIVSIEETNRGATVMADLLGLQDDSVAGTRVIVALTGSDNRWNVGAVTQFPLCWRGVSGSGLCS